MNMPCSSRDCINSAVALAPQVRGAVISQATTQWIWVAACEEHLHGWWRGCDIPHHERPSIVPYHARRNSA